MPNAWHREAGPDSGGVRAEGGGIVPIEIYRFYATPIWLSAGGAICPLCGVASNPYPCYGEGEGAAVPHRLSYCDHPLEDTPYRIYPPRLPMEVE